MLVGREAWENRTYEGQILPFSLSFLRSGTWKSQDKRGTSKEREFCLVIFSVRAEQKNLKTSLLGLVHHCPVFGGTLQHCHVSRSCTPLSAIEKRVWNEEGPSVTSVECHSPSEGHPSIPSGVLWKHQGITKETPLQNTDPQTNIHRLSFSPSTRNSSLLQYL